MKRSPHKYERKVLAKLLRQIRRKKNLTQTELAKKLNKPQPFVSKYENCERLLDLIELIDICENLDISIFNLIKKFQKKK